MRHTSLLRCLLLPCALSGMASPATPCSCAPDRTIQDQLAEAEVVFRGITLSRDEYHAPAGAPELDTGYAVRFRVLEVWKGTPDREFVVVSGPGNCRFPHEVGEAYLVFAARWPKAGRQFWTNRCAGTRPATAEEATAVLGSPKSALRSTSQ